MGSGRPTPPSRSNFLQWRSTVKELLSPKLLGSLIVGLMALIGVVVGSVMNRSATLEKIAEQEVVEQADTAVAGHLTSLVRSAVAETREERDGAERLSTVSKSRMVLCGTESLVGSPSKLEELNCFDSKFEECREV